MITVTDRRTGDRYDGPTPEEIVASVWGEAARIRYSRAPNSRGEATVVERDTSSPNSFHVLAELHMDGDALAARTTPDLEATGRALRATRDQESELRKLMAEQVRQLVPDVWSEAEAARQAGVDRMSIRTWLGKR